MNEKFDMAIIGGGPGGYVAALRGAQLKKKVVLFEKDRVGGTCMNRGCIPAKFLLHQTKTFKETIDNKFLDGPLDDVSCNWEKVQDQRKKIVERFVQGIEFLLKKNGIQLVKGDAKLLNERQIQVREGDNNNIYEAECIILATGSRPADLPFLQPDRIKVITSKEGLALAEVPEDMVIVGADRIAANYDVANKIGTYEKAVLAHENDIPFYVAAPASTFDWSIECGADIKIEERCDSEVTKIFDYHPSLVKNPAFDVTPARYVTGIITKDGIIKPEVN